MPATITPNPTPIADCRVCNGSGIDEAFGSTCLCPAHVQVKSAYLLAAEAALGGTVAPRPAPTGKPNGTGKAAAVKTNRYPGKCSTCSGPVAAEAGLLIRDGQGWAVRHHPGQCVEAVEAPAPVAATTAPATLPDVAEGHYAIASTGANDLAFYRVVKSDKWGTSVRLVVGGHVDTFVRRAAVPGILARIAADPDAAARYGQEIGRCCRCNRTLTDETSRALGIGPECRKAGA